MRLFQRIFQTRLAAIAARHEKRDVEADTAVFDRRGLMLAVGLLVAFALWQVYRGITPPPSVVGMIDSRPEIYLKQPNAKVFFSPALEPAQIGAVEKHAITLPNRTIDRLPGYRRDGIWYEFDLSIPADKFVRGETALLIPLVWGKSRVFVDERLYGYGENYWPVIGLDRNPSRILVRADVETTTTAIPISAIYPPVNGSIAALKQITQTIADQEITHQISRFPFLVGITFLGAIFLAYRRRPELLAFLAFLSASYAYGELDAQENLKVVFFGHAGIQTALLLGLDFLLHAMLMLFSLLFFRIPFIEAQRSLRIPLFGALVLSLAIATLAYRWGVGTSSFRQLSHITFSIAFLCLNVRLLVPELWHLIRNSEATRLRKTAGLFVAITILFLYAINILDYYGLFTSLTTQYRNAFVVYMTLSLFVAFEAARAEGHKRTMSKWVSKEAKRGLELGQNEISAAGFIILVDAIGFTASRQTFDDVGEMRKSIASIFGPIAGAVAKGNKGNISLFNSTGDGLYFSFKGEASAENLGRVLGIAEDIVAASQEAHLRLRVAIGYGAYTVFLFNNGDFQKEAVCGAVLNDLSRIIGGEGIRLLMGPEVERLGTFAPLSEAQDKHGHVHYFYEEKRSAA